MNVLALTRYQNQGASSRVRFYQYLPILEKFDINVTVAPFFRNKYLEDLYCGGRRNIGLVVSAYSSRLKSLLRFRRFDLIWTQYEILPWLPPWIEQFLAAAGIPQVIDYDDSVFHSYHQLSLIPRSLLGSKIEKIMRCSSMVVAGNHFLAERAVRAGAKRVEVIPSVVDLSRYRLVPQQGNGTFTIGWIGTPITVGYLNTISDVLAKVCAIEDVRLKLVGAGHPDSLDIDAEVIPWQDTTEVDEIRKFDIGIMPLSRTDLEEGKCGYKLIQYMAAAKPVIATPTGANETIIKTGVAGFLPRDSQEWWRAFQTLKNDPQLCENMGQAGRARVEKYFSLEKSAPRLASILKSVMKPAA